VRRKIGEAQQSIANYKVPTITATTFSFEAQKEYAALQPAPNAQ
jgi:hypothetical protein